MKYILAINTSPRKGWNTAALVRTAAQGVQVQGARAEVIDLYTLGQFTGCISCFACKKEPNRGRCVCQDALSPVLEKIRAADGLILGTANYLCSATAGFHALYERLVFQSLTYQKENMCCNDHLIPVLLIFTSNTGETVYTLDTPEGRMLRRYQNTLSVYVGPTDTFVYGDTLQVQDYSSYQWDIFDPDEKQKSTKRSFQSRRKSFFSLVSNWSAIVAWSNNVARIDN